MDSSHGRHRDLCGAILFSLGILGAYVSRIFEQVKRRPVYLLKDQSSDL